MAASVAHDNVIIVTWANDHFADFVFNWVHHIKVHGIQNYLVLPAFPPCHAQCIQAQSPHTFLCGFMFVTPRSLSAVWL
jgi:hypothetical protein